ncbi:bZIP transcription factor [Bacillus cereus group sp. Bce022]|uniref:bZIP transcription factor n=1 Tax=Bacillus cereus group TaxID=86661 RepID=UPI0003AE06BB|nr:MULTISPECIES: bZIP transcription factor [Bacillus cereus group]ETE93218.1 hypothetical protein C623_0225460 [Bacillus thuringiensis serovar aizawai str. Hu4-2]MEC2958241.1 bZIP transcription factor [Bacillus cereus]OUA15195.1 hypothetical protein BK777_29555 [Bacillus thuringiensis serovar aizawai]
MFFKKNRERIEYLERKIEQLTSENKELQEKLNEKMRLFNPRWRKEITVSPYIFDKYIRNMGRTVIGGYHVPCGDGTYYVVKIDEEMSDGYIRYEVAFEEPHADCKKCGETFLLVNGYPSGSSDFCSYKCYTEFLK